MKSLLISLWAAAAFWIVGSVASAQELMKREIVARTVDASEFEEYREGYGETVLCGYARIGGWAS